MANALMESSVTSKSERIQARIPKEIKALIERAASFQGVTVSDFLIISARKAAMETIEEHQIIRLNEEETERFVQTFLNPPAPNEALKKLMQEDD